MGMAEQAVVVMFLQRVLVRNDDVCPGELNDLLLVNANVVKEILYHHWFQSPLE
jgi:hypothetical protein